ncbi:MAG: sigma-70 family RNA polymerase sigma factor [Deltaproteobacteria bacterium]|nr:sigma-70 family RNA polymerase sigma factor [Deltaproteobacteria bacterium]
MSGDGQAELIRRCQAGEERAWHELYRAHAPLVARFVGRMVGAGGPVDDLVQAVFVEVFRGLRRFRGDARLTTWLYGIAHRVTAKHLRGEGRRRRREQRFADEGPLAARSPEPARAAREALAVVERAVLSLPEPQRAVWVMRELEGLSTAEVAEALGTRQGTVRSRLFAAREAVLAALAAAPDEGDDGEDALTTMATSPPRARREEEVR